LRYNRETKLSDLHEEPLATWVHISDLRASQSSNGLLFGHVEALGLQHLDGTNSFADEFPFHLAGEDDDFGEFGHG